MKRLYFLFQLFFLISIVFSQSKQAFDLDLRTNEKSNELAESNFINHIVTNNNSLEYSLLEGAFFTLGTINGQSDSKFDDFCQLTYGHPFALTSYPSLTVDGDTKKIADLFEGATSLLMEKNDTLIIKYYKENYLGYTFKIFPEDLETINLSLNVKNYDVISHEIRHNLIYDAALGKWGDGTLKINDQFFISGSEFSGAELPSLFEIWEKNNSHKGIGNQIQIDAENTEAIKFDNWFNLSESEEINVSSNFALFDMAFNLISKTRTLIPNEEFEYQISVKLIEPDFPTNNFIRWDLNPFLTLSNNLLFPSNFKSYAEISSNFTGQIGSIEFEGESIISFNIDQPEFITESNNNFIEVELNSRTIYQDMVLPLTLKLFNSTSQVDEITKYIYVPASPFSNEGLEVSIDSLIIDEFPQLSLSFSSKISETGKLISQLYNENILLYENDNRILDFVLSKDTTGGSNEADIIFVLDVTGSMSNEIAAVRNNIIEFGDSLEERGIDYRLGMVTFLDEIENVYNFTSDITQFKNWVSQQYAHGGDDYPENSLDALDRATQFQFRDASNRIIIWITDAQYHINDGVFTTLTIQDVVNSMLSLGIVTYCIGNPDEQTTYYNPIVQPTGGEYYSINGNFRDILLEISRLEASSQFLLKYNSNSQLDNNTKGKLEIHYAGLGGAAEFVIGSNPSAENILVSKSILQCYPNPFNPVTNIQVVKPKDEQGQVTIFNILGQKVKHFEIESGMEKINLMWNATNESNLPISTGFYIVNIRLFDSFGNISSNQSQKLLYLK